MKKILATLTLALCLCGQAFGFGRYVHATIVYIAEQQLTPTAAQNIKRLAGNKSIVYYASYCDAYKKQMLIDLGFEPENSKRITTLPHTMSIETATGEPCKGYRYGDTYVVNLIPFVVEAEEWLTNNTYEPADSVALSKLLILLHQIGDMHCMGHIREYPLLDPARARCYYDVTVHGTKMKYHTWLDDGHITERYPWSYSDLAHILDNYTDEEHRQMASGDIYDWARDIYAHATFTLSFKEGASLTKKDCDKIRQTSEELIVKAGYRMAEVLNRTFDSEYAKTAAKACPKTGSKAKK